MQGSTAVGQLLLDLDKESPQNGSLFILSGTYYSCAQTGELQWSVQAVQQNSLHFFGVSISNATLFLNGTAATNTSKNETDSGRNFTQWSGEVAGEFNIAESVVAAAVVQIDPITGVHLHASVNFTSTYVDLNISIDYIADPNCTITPAFNDSLDAYNISNFRGQVQKGVEQLP